MGIQLSTNPPIKGEIENYYLEPLTTQTVLEDWLTLTSNADAIVATRGGGSRKEWPYVCSLEENYKDLAWLEVCFNYKQLFSYVLRSKRDRIYCGCIYIYPIDLFYEELSTKYDIDFSFWVTQTVLDKGEYDEIYSQLIKWLEKVWKFDLKKVYLRNKLKLNEGAA